MMDRIENNKISEQIIARPYYLAEKIVFIDGLPGCGKTLFSSLISAFDRVEKLTYAYEIEHLCALHHLNKIEKDAVVAMVGMLTDLVLYDTMMSREVNCRPSDLSSIFHHPDTMKYLKRFFQKGDFAIPDRIAKEKPILPLTVHNLLTVAYPIFDALQERVVFIEIVRHPLYMIIQQALNNEKMIFSARDFSIYFQYKNENLPWYVSGWEELFINANPVEKAIYFMDKVGGMMENSRSKILKDHPGQVITIPFERFVFQPMSYMQLVESAMGSKITRQTLRTLKKQNVPREKISDGIPLDVYKRCGWVPPKEGLNEMEELAVRRDFAAQSASPEAMEVLDRLSAAYEKEFMSDIVDINLDILNLPHYRR